MPRSDLRQAATNKRERDNDIGQNATKKMFRRSPADPPMFSNIPSNSPSPHPSPQINRLLPEANALENDGHCTASKANLPSWLLANECTFPLQADSVSQLLYPCSLFFSLPFCLCFCFFAFTFIFLK